MSDLEPIRSGRADSPDGEGWLAWWVFPAGVDVEDVLTHHDICPYAGGLTYGLRPVVRRGRSVVVISQRGGWDV